MTVQGDFGKIIDVVRRKLCYLRVYLGNVSLNHQRLEDSGLS